MFGFFVCVYFVVGWFIIVCAFDIMDSSVLGIYLWILVNICMAFALLFGARKCNETATTTNQNKIRHGHMCAVSADGIICSRTQIDKVMCIFGRLQPHPLSRHPSGCCSHFQSFCHSKKKEREEKIKHFKSIWRASIANVVSLLRKKWGGKIVFVWFDAICASFKW